MASVVEGVVALSKTMEDGRTQMVGLLLSSGFIGRPGRNQIEFDVTATSDVTLFCFQHKPFEEMVEQTPHLAQRLMELALDELDAARDWMLLLGRKIATFLEMLNRRSRTPDMSDPGGFLTLPMSREQIANYLGLSLETVSRQLTILKKDGQVSFKDRRRPHVTDAQALQRATIPRTPRAGEASCDALRHRASLVALKSLAAGREERSNPSHGLTTWDQALSVTSLNSNPVRP